MTTRTRHMASTAVLAAGALALAACGERVEDTDTAVVSPPAADTAATTDMATQPGYTDPAAPVGTATTPGAGVATTTPGTAGAPGTTTTTPGPTSSVGGATGAAGAMSATGAASDASAVTSRFTDRQLQQFAQAVSNIRRQQTGGASAAATSMSDDDPDVAIRQAGLTSETYMQIAAAALTDDALRQKISQQPGWSAASR